MTTHQKLGETPARTSAGKNTQGVAARDAGTGAPSRSPDLSHEEMRVLELQRQFGNQTVARLLQPKLTIGAPDDEYEREADDVARDVVSRWSAPAPDANRTVRRAAGDEDEDRARARRQPALRRDAEEDAEDTGDDTLRARPGGPAVRREEDADDERLSRQALDADDDEVRARPRAPRLQRHTSGPSVATPEVEQSIRSARGAGQPMAESVRAPMEHAFDTNFGRVSLHTDARADHLNAAVQARAFTIGRDIFFRGGEYRPESSGGRELLAHELTHVVQQAGGDPKAARARRTRAPGAQARRRTDASAVAREQAAAFARTHGRPHEEPRISRRPQRALQRRSSNGVSVSGMRFAPRDIPADGATTTQGSVRYAGRVQAGATIVWSIVGPNFGSAIDATGKLTPGAAITAGKEKVRVKVKAQDSVHAGAHSHGRFNLWDAKFFQAKIDHPKFLAKTFKKDPFTAGINGKFALVYRPRSRRLDATIRVSLTFKDDKAGAAKWNPVSRRSFRRTFVRVVQSRWSGQYRFLNKRPPQKIWGKLNPVSVRVRVKQDKKTPHFAITVHKKSIGAQVVAGTARFSASDLKSSPAFNPKTGVAELTALAALTPTPILFAAGKSSIKAADQKKLQFMATYLRRIRTPRFKVNITGHHQKVVHPVAATANQKRTALRQARRLSLDRAAAVRQVLKDGRATFHRIRHSGIGDKGAAAVPAWDKAVIASALPTGFTNVQTTLEHEAGHMFGIGDEYLSAGTVVGDKTSHYGLTLNAFGKQYADVQARRVADSASLMNGGRDIRPHHYVTFWDGLSQLTAAAGVPVPPFGQADWKFQGE